MEKTTVILQVRKIPHDVMVTIDVLAAMNSQTRSEYVRNLLIAHSKENLPNFSSEVK